MSCTLAARVLEQRGYVFERAELEHPRLLSRLLRQCERAKCRLSRADAAEVAVPDERGELPEGRARVTVTRRQLEDWTAPILARVEGPVRRVLADAGLKRGDVDEVILVGGMILAMGPDQLGSVFGG